jgi:hypothetical protein
MLNRTGTVTAREVAPFVESRRDAARYAAFFNFSALLVCLLAGMVHVPPDVKKFLNRGHGLLSQSACASLQQLSFTGRRRHPA